MEIALLLVFIIKTGIDFSATAAVLLVATAILSWLIVFPVINALLARKYSRHVGTWLCFSFGIPVITFMMLRKLGPAVKCPKCNLGNEVEDTICRHCGIELDQEADDAGAGGEEILTTAKRSNEGASG